MTAAPSGDPQDLNRQSLLIQKLLQKTAQGRIAWQRLPSSISAVTPNGMQFDFILSATIPGAAGQTWVSFTARDQGVEILKSQRNDNLLQLVLGAQSTGPIQRLLDALFQAAAGRAFDNMGRAIAKLDQL
jgi:hypothetical protein